MDSITVQFQDFPPHVHGPIPLLIVQEAFQTYDLEAVSLHATDLGFN